MILEKIPNLVQYYDAKNKFHEYQDGFKFREIKKSEIKERLFFNFDYEDDCFALDYWEDKSKELETEIEIDGAKIVCRCRLHKSTYEPNGNKYIIKILAGVKQ